MSSPGSTRICKTCGNRFNGIYCNHCGEKIINENDRTLKHFFGELINAFTFADNKLWRTLKVIIKNPGFLSKEFAEGRRKPYMKPVSIFFLANLIYFLFPLINTFTTPLNVQRNSIYYSPLVVEWVDEVIDQRNVSFEEYRAVYDTKTTELSKLLLVVFAYMLAILFWPIHLGSKRKYFADHLTVSLEAMTFILLFIIQLFGLIAVILRQLDIINLGTNFYSTSFACLALTYFFYFMERKFYSFKPWRAFLNTVLCLSAILVCLIGYRALLFFITFWSI
ncbi:DUF3667 domain-containing protein [Ekhidna sp.]|uniref:DUF3667 domain-containing protein n=1 Tax=Ekhidna sp. TaxID=2608089 RepID=UPI003CCBFD0C